MNTENKEGYRVYKSGVQAYYSSKCSNQGIQTKHAIISLKKDMGIIGTKTLRKKKMTRYMDVYTSPNHNNRDQ